MPLGMEIGLDPGDFVSDGDPATPRKKGTHPTKFLAHVYCGQTAGWIKMPLGTEVNLDPGDIVLDGVAAPPKRGTAPQLSVHVCCGQTAGWTKTPLGTEVDLRPGHIVLGSQLSAKGAQYPPSFGRMCGHGRLPQLLLSSCINSFNLNVAIDCFAQCGRLKVSRNVSVSALQGLGLGLVSVS